MSTHIIGILGGMGPEAGVYFQKRIVEKTPATIDQEHIKSILYTNPQIADRATAILQKREEDFVYAISDSLKLLEAMGVSELFIPCNTSFVGYGQYCSELTIPLYNLPGKTIEYIEEKKYQSPYLLATLGTYAADVYADTATTTISIPDESSTDIVQALISAIKGRTREQDSLFKQVVGLIQDKSSVILGCTELSLVSADFAAACPDVVFIDPLDIAASYIVLKYAPVNSSVIR